MPTSLQRPLTLVQTEAQISGHQCIEEALFTLCGAWSTEPAKPSGFPGDELQAFFATQSALHAWRQEQWAQRLPRSVPATDAIPTKGWSAALNLARAQTDGPTRLACWAVALQPSLAARYRHHQLHLAPAADQGLDRWLGIALGDVLDGCVTGGELLARAFEQIGASTAVVVAAEALGSVLHAG